MPPKEKRHQHSRAASQTKAAFLFTLFSAICLAFGIPNIIIKPVAIKITVGTERGMTPVSPLYCISFFISEE